MSGIPTSKTESHNLSQVTKCEYHKYECFCDVGETENPFESYGASSDHLSFAGFLGTSEADWNQGPNIIENRVQSFDTPLEPEMFSENLIAHTDISAENSLSHPSSEIQNVENGTSNQSEHTLMEV